MNPKLLLCSLAGLFAAAAAVAQNTPPMTLAPPPPPIPGEWVVLFDGEKVTNMRGLQKPDFLKAGWKIVDGTLHLPKEVDDTGKLTGGDLIATPIFPDFEFEFEWKLGVSSDTGILYGARAGGPGGRAIGYEFQIIDDVRNPDSMKGGKIRRTGALDRLLAPTVEVKAMTGKPNENTWNSGKLLVLGNHVEHWVNGDLVLTYDFGSMELMRAIRDSKLKLGPTFGYKVKSGVIILDQGEEVSFRALRIRPLTPTAPGPTGNPVPPPTPGGATPPPAATPPAAPVRGGPTPFKSRIPPS